MRSRSWLSTHVWQNLHIDGPNIRRRDEKPPSRAVLHTEPFHVRYSEGSSRLAREARSFGAPQDDIGLRSALTMLMVAMLCTFAGRSWGQIDDRQLSVDLQTITQPASRSIATD